MKDKTDAFMWGIVTGAMIITLMIVITRPVLSQQKRDRQEAITNGAAHWVVDTNGETSFEWNKQ